jgi:thiamine-monophosphate kinase
VRAVTAAPLTEDSLIAAIADALGQPARPLRVGIGDDAAAWQPNPHHLELITGDMLVDGVHFRLHGTTPEALGHKALAKNLSDIAAMGGRPLLAVVALGITPELDEAWYRAFYTGMSALARRSRCAIAGGDLVRAPALTIAVTVVGEVRKTSMRLRSGARAGDVVAVTGPLGLAAAGLRLLDSSMTARSAQRAIDAYLTPNPRIAEGVFLGSRRAVHALMDISDGLSTDLGRMARGSAVDAIVERDALHIAPALQAAVDDPIDLVLNGGDDYELLAAVDRGGFEHVARTFERRFGRPLARVGRFEPGAGRLWIEAEGMKKPLTAGGYDHFRR